MGHEVHDRALQAGRCDVQDRNVQAGLVRGQDPLEGHAVLVLGEDGPQALVPGHHVPHRPEQGVGVERTRQPQRERRVVGGRGALEPVDEPQAALGEGQRHPLGARADARQRRTHPCALRQVVRQFHDGRGAEDDPDRQLYAEHRPHPADQSCGEQGVAAEVEEVVVDADAVQAEDLGEQAAQQLFLRGARSPSRRHRREVRHGQRPAVQLPVRRQRQLGDGHEGGGQHVVGEVLGEVGA
nr:hypothetical protein [Streptomyces alboflavus]